MHTRGFSTPPAGPCFRRPTSSVVRRPRTLPSRAGAHPALRQSSRLLCGAGLCMIRRDARADIMEVARAVRRRPAWPLDCSDPHEDPEVKRPTSNRLPS